jgi:hypothetical protein
MDAMRAQVQMQALLHNDKQTCDKNRPETRTMHYVYHVAMAGSAGIKTNATVHGRPLILPIANNKPPSPCPYNEWHCVSQKSKVSIFFWL